MICIACIRNEENAWYLPVPAILHTLSYLYYCLLQRQSVPLSGSTHVLLYSDDCSGAHDGTLLVDLLRQRIEDCMAQIR